MNLAPANENLTAQLTRATLQAQALGTKLVAAVHLSITPSEDLERLAAAC